MRVDKPTSQQRNSVLFDAMRIDAAPTRDEQTLSVFSTVRLMGFARRFAWIGGLVEREQPAFTYTVLKPRHNLCDKRAYPRMRTRLRTGKIVDGRNGFLTECRMHDRSKHGARLELIRAVDVSDGLRMFDDETGLLFSIRPVWRGQNVLGVVLEACSLDPAGAPLGRSHYALP